MRSGGDVTILCYSRMRYVVMQGVQELEKAGYNPEARSSNIADMLLTCCCCSCLSLPLPLPLCIRGHGFFSSVSIALYPSSSPSPSPSPHPRIVRQFAPLLLSSAPVLKPVCTNA